MMPDFNFIDSLGDGVYGVDAEGLCLFINKAGLDILGYERADEVLGQNMHSLIHHTRANGSAYPAAECPLLHTAVSGVPVRLRNELLWKRDRTSFYADYSAFAVLRDGAPAATVVTFNDTSVRQAAQKRLTLQFAVSQVLAGSASAEWIPQDVLEVIGAGLDWDIGLYWTCGDDQTTRCMAEWQSVGAGEASRFAEASVGLQFEMGVGLPGKVWAAKSAIHYPDISGLIGPRRKAAAECGLRSAFAFPIMAGQDVAGVLEFFGRSLIAVDDSLKETVATLGHQIGQTLEHRRIAGALAAHEDLKSAILASAPDGIITIDADGRILEFNTAAETIFGRLAQEVQGEDLASLIFPAVAVPVHRRAFAKALQGDEAMLARRSEFGAMRADGTVFPLEFSMTKTATHPKLLFTLHLRDITRRQQEQARLRENEARFRTIANAIPQLAWMTGPDGGIVWFNQRWYDYTGATLDAMRGWGWTNIQHPDHRDRVERSFGDAIEVCGPWEDSFPLRSSDGTYRWFLTRALPIQEAASPAFPDGRLLGWFGSNTDITAMRDVEQTLAAARDEAESANRAKSTFIANMSHELRTPLSAIIGYAEMLSEEIEDGVAPSDVAADVQKIEGNARHLLGLINDVLDLAKVESGKMTAFAETFDVGAMSRDVAVTVGGLVEKKGNRLELQLGDDLGSAHSDVTRIRQLMLNLLSNAAKFTEDGVITLSVAREDHARFGDSLRIAVKDTGIGLTEDQVDKLFQRFQQADASTTRQFGGTGLGLALTKAFCTLLGGTIEVESTVGEGSTFTAIVPAVLPEASTSSPVMDDEPEPPAIRRDVILVVDDDATQRDLTSRFLTRNGFAARVAADGATGLALARQIRPRAILLDVTMPGMDGWSVLNALKADPAVAGIPVVMVTFLTERPLAMALGAADYIVKPVDWDRLRHVMERFRDAEGDVLLVEDDPDTRQRLRSTLEKHGWTVAEAADGQKALDSVLRAVPRVILLDLNMPVMDGFEFLDRLRERPGCADVPVVVLTALDLTNEDRRRLRGADQVLSKGTVSLQEIAEIIRRLGPPPE